MRHWLVLLLVFPLCLPAAAAEKAAYDSNGRIVALLSDAEDVAVSTSVVAVIPNGRRIPLQVRANRVGAVRQGSALAWTQQFSLPAGGSGQLDLKSEEDAASVKYTTAVKAAAAFEVDAIEFVVDLPRDLFLNGRVSPQGATPLTLAIAKPPAAALYQGETAGLRVQDATGNVALDIGFDKPVRVSVVDRWDANGRSYQVRAAVLGGSVAASAGASLATSLRLANKTPAPLVARLALDASRPWYKFDGFGGNYCWSNSSPVAAYTLKNLKVAWARTEMKAQQWDR